MPLPYKRTACKRLCSWAARVLASACRNCSSSCSLSGNCLFARHRSYIRNLLFHLSISSQRLKTRKVQKLKALAQRHRDAEKIKRTLIASSQPHPWLASLDIPSPLQWGGERGEGFQARNHGLAIRVTLPFDDQAAAIYGPMRAKLEAAATPIGSHNMLITAVALANNLIVVTHNTRHFSLIDGLKLEAWEV